jgi:hypothetical protein
MGPSLRRQLQTAAFLLIGAALSHTVPSHAKASPIASVEVTTKVSRKNVDVPAIFRSEVLRQLRTLEVDRSGEEDLVLSASLLRLDTQRTGSRAHSSCVVSARLQKKNGALVAVLRGRARAEDDIKATSDNELAALRAAVRSTLRGIPEALR